MTTKTVQISPEVELEEQAAMIGYLRNRSMIQAQAIAELKAERAMMQTQITNLNEALFKHGEAITRDGVEAIPQGGKH